MSMMDKMMELENVMSEDETETGDPDVAGLPVTSSSEAPA